MTEKEQAKEKLCNSYMHSKIYEAAAAVGTLSFGRKVAPPKFYESFNEQHSLKPFQSKIGFDLIKVCGIKPH